MKKVETVKTAKAAALGLVRLLLVFLTFSALNLIPSVLSAEVPMKFNYQGNLRQAGFLVNGTRHMVFRIYNSSDPLTSVELCPSLEYDVTISTGVFRVTLEPVISNWQNGSLWLELEIQGHRLSPREELTSSPYSVNSRMISGKKYTTGTAPATPEVTGDLWMDTNSGMLKFWNGGGWILTSDSGSPINHAATHSAGGIDAIVNLGAHTVTGPITFNSSGELRTTGGVSAITIAADAVVQGTLNPGSNLLVGGAGYSVSFASSVSAGWYYGDGSGLDNLNAYKIVSGQINGDRIAAGVLVSTHIADGSIRREKLHQSGCAAGEVLKWDGTQWVCTSVMGLEADPLSIWRGDLLQPTTFYVSSGTVNSLYATDLSVRGVLNPASNLSVGAAGYSVSFASSVSAGWLHGNGSDLTNLDAGRIASGQINGDRIAAGVLVSTHVAEGSIVKEKLGPSGCANGNILQLSGSQWICGSGAAVGLETDPLSIWKGDILQPTTFYVSSGTVNDFNVNDSLKVSGTALLKGAPGYLGLSVEATGNVGIGTTGAANSRLAVKGVDTQNYSLAVGTGPAPYQVVVTTSGALGVGTAAPQAKLEVSGKESPGSYIMIFNSGTKLAAWLRNK